MEFKDWIREQLDISGFTSQKDFAELIGVSQGTLSRYLAGGEPRYGELVDICKALGVPLFGVAMEQEQADPDTEVRKALLKHPGLSQKEAEFFYKLIAAYIKAWG